MAPTCGPNAAATGSLLCTFNLQMQEQSPLVGDPVLLDLSLVQLLPQGVPAIVPCKGMIQNTSHQGLAL